MNTKELRKKLRIGRYATIRWVDCGDRDCIIVDVPCSRSVIKKSGHNYIKVIEVGEDNSPRSVSFDQIIDIRGDVKSDRVVLK